MSEYSQEVIRMLYEEVYDKNDGDTWIEFLDAVQASLGMTPKEADRAVDFLFV